MVSRLGCILVNQREYLTKLVVDMDQETVKAMLDKVLKDKKKVAKFYFVESGHGAYFECSFKCPSCGEKNYVDVCDSNKFKCSECDCNLKVRKKIWIEKVR